jgi:hypothetical protein
MWGSVACGSVRSIAGEDLPVHTYFLESEHSGSNGWPTVVVPSVVAPSLAPPGHHVLHATITEPFAPWIPLDRSSRAYRARKEERAAILWDMVRQVRCTPLWPPLPPHPRGAACIVHLRGHYHAWAPHSSTASGCRSAQRAACMRVQLGTARSVKENAAGHSTQHACTHA